tara:strand:+ start:168 stop:557 length:390 start_codon:yes stop_codon:yes gene_type:complete
MLSHRRLGRQQFLRGSGQEHSIYCAYALLHDRAVEADKNCRWHSRNPKFAETTTVLTPTSRVGHAQLTQKGVGVVPGAQASENSNIDSYKLYLVLEFLVENLQLGHLDTARRAQTGPEIQHQRFALEPG